jgi:hypothetical protein
MPESIDGGEDIAGGVVGGDAGDSQRVGFLDRAAEAIQDALGDIAVGVTEADHGGDAGILHEAGFGSGGVAGDEEPVEGVVGVGDGT